MMVGIQLVSKNYGRLWALAVLIVFVIICGLLESQVLEELVKDEFERDDIVDDAPELQDPFKNLGDIHEERKHNILGRLVYLVLRIGCME